MQIFSRVRKVALRFLLGFVIFMLIGNGAILAFHLGVQLSAEAKEIEAPAGLMNFQAVSDKLWRGSHPSVEGYKALADRGVRTIVDLRAEENLHVPEKMLARRGVRVVHIRMRDGQAPTAAQVERFLRVAKASKGKVYVHCMAGVGRTGTMVAAYLVELEGESALTALEKNLAVGPPSLEQIAFVAGDIEKPNPVLTGLSRVLDGPRRIWTYVD